MKNKENLIKNQLLNINLPSSNLQERVFAEIRKQNKTTQNMENEKEETMEKDYKNSIKTSGKTPWYTYLSVAAVVCVIAGTTFAFSQMDKSNNNGGDETTVTTITSDTSETTSVVTSVKKDKAIVTSIVENTSQVETTSAGQTKVAETPKIEGTQTSNQQNIYEDGEKYSWFKQPVYDFDDVEPIVNAYNKYVKCKIVYCDGFKVSKDGSYEIVDINGDLKIDISYMGIYSGISNGFNGYIAEKSEDESIWFDLDYNIVNNGGSGFMRNRILWDIKENKAIIYDEGEGSSSITDINEAEEWIMDMHDNNIYLVEFAEYIAPSNDSVPWERYKELEQYALCKDNKLITSDVYTSATDLSDNCVAFEKDGKWGYLNEKGEQILPFEYDTAYGDIVRYEIDSEREKKYPFICTEGIIAAFKDGQCGYYDNKGNVIVEMGVFEDITPVKEGKAFVKKDGKWGIIKINN